MMRKVGKSGSWKDRKSESRKVRKSESPGDREPGRPKDSIELKPDSYRIMKVEII